MRPPGVETQFQNTFLIQLLGKDVLFLLGLKGVEHKSGAGSGHLQPHRESQPEREDNTELRGRNEGFLKTSFELFLSQYEARIYPSDFVSSVSQ